MKNNRQQSLTKWLKQQSVISRYWLNIARLLGFINGLLIISKSYMLAYIMHHMITKSIQRGALLPPFTILLIILIVHVWVTWLYERTCFHAGKHIRFQIRRQVLDKIAEAGPTWIQGRPVGSWATLIIEQVDYMHDYYARYLPQMMLAINMPLLIFAIILPTNWIAALILLLTAPLIPLFMMFVGTGAAEANRLNFFALARLSGNFLDRLRGMETLRIFGRGTAEIENIRLASQDFRQRTMEVLRLAFLSSGVLEFFASLSIALVAAYFGFSYLGVFNFGHYGTIITLSSGFLVLILAPEFFRPLRDLGIFYHAKAQAIGAADNLKTFLETPLINPECIYTAADINEPLTLVAKDLSVISPNGVVLAGPFNFTLSAGQRVVLVGTSGSGKSSLLNALSGFMVYTGSLCVNGIELRSIKPDIWRNKISWVGQNPHLLAVTLRENIILGCPDVCEADLQSVLDSSLVNEFLTLLPNGIETIIGDQGVRLSVGQLQRIAIARALLHPCHLLLLDEPAASLDLRSERRIMRTLKTASHQQTTLMATHRLEGIADWDNIWVMDNGRIVEQGNFSALIATHGYFATLLMNCQKDI